MTQKIFLSPPNMGGKELQYVVEAFNQNWIAPAGPSISAFEKEMAAYVGLSSALAVTSGTAAIHLALRSLNVKPGDYIFCSDFTFIGSCDAILYENCTPVFIDSEPDTWNMSPTALEKAFEWADKQGKLPKAIIIVDLYGESADWDKLIPLCKHYGVPIIEDAAEALGAIYNGKQCGSFGDISVLSFNGNKIVTTSSGGMVLSNDKTKIDKMRFWSTQARENELHYEHKEYGYNYRMSNICASIGLGQLEYLPYKLQRRQEIKSTYCELLADLPLYIKREHAPKTSNNWLSVMVLQTNQISAAEIVLCLQEQQIEARPAWKPMHMQPLFHGAAFFTHQTPTSIGEQLFNYGICLPSGDGMTPEQQLTVINALKSCLTN